jgi:hypothetical protein
MPRVPVIRGGIRHDPFWKRAVKVIIGLLIIFLGFAFAFPEIFLGSGLPVEGIFIEPVWLRLMIAFALLVMGVWLVIYGWVS